MKPVFIDFTIIISNFAIDKSMQKPMGRMMMYRLLVACILMSLPTVAGAYDFIADGIYYDLVDGHAVSPITDRPIATAVMSLYPKPSPTKARPILSLPSVTMPSRAVLA